jgi:signal transduction histidine kinase/CheY-like chemotaxis protein
MIQKAREEGYNRFEWLHKRKNGELFWMDVMLTSIIMNSENYIHMIGRDISNIKKIHKELEESKNYLYSIIKRLPIPIIVYSDTDEITFINNSFNEVLKFSKEDIPDTESWWNLTIKDSRKRNELKENWEKAVSKMKRDNDVVDQQWVIHTKDNKEKTCEFFAIRIKGEILVVINDISEVVSLNHELLAAKEKAQESNRLKSAFLANLSHELRTPMNGILGFSQLLASDDLSDEERLNYVEIIRQSGNRLLSMINDIINISKIDANQIEIFTESVPLLPIISEIIEFYKFEAKAKNIDFLFESANLSKDIYVHTDESKLKQIFANIIGNAIKYTPEGEVVVSTNVYKDYIEIIVTDTGYGIKEEKQNQIFERFVRLEETSDKTDGTGLGLAISQAYAKRLGIKIFVKSKYGIGSEFIIQIPMESDKPKIISKAETIKDDGDYETPDLTGKNILIAEDEDLNYMILKLYIENTNANIFRAENGKNAVEIVAKNRIDFVFMDIKMPVMDGMEAMKIIKKAFPSIPVVAQTAYTFSEDKDKALAQGFNDYLSKPLSKKTVIEILRKYFFTEAGETVV